MKFKSAETGQRVWLVRPMCMFTPWRKGSVLDAFSRICTMLGDIVLSSAMSEKFRWVDAS